MNKLLLGAAISAALFTGAASAATVAPSYGFAFDATTGVPTPGTVYNSVKIFMAGSSAAKGLFEQALLENSASSPCLAGTVHKFRDSSSENQVAYICKLNTAINGAGALTNSNIPTSLSGSAKNLVLYKRHAGGSYMGVGPVIESKGLIDFLNVDTNSGVCAVASTSSSLTAFASTTNCAYTANTTVGAKTSTTSTLAIPTFGVSDINPQLFTVAAGNATTLISGTTTATPDYSKKYSSLAITQGPQQVFGVVVTTKLRAALQEAQFAASSTCNPLNAGYTIGLTGTAESEDCMPNMSTDQVSQIFAARSTTDAKGRFHDWDQLMVKTGGSYTNLWDATTSTYGKTAGMTNPKVHICSRTIGSGTKAQFGVKFLKNGCLTPSSVKAGTTTAALPIVGHLDHIALGEVGEAGYVATGWTAGASAVEAGMATAPMVHAMATGGGVLECLDELDQGVITTAGSFTAGTAYGSTADEATRWAIGFSGTDTNATNGKNARFIKINGAAPTLANVVNGTYPDWVEATFQTNKKYLAGVEAKAVGTSAMVDALITAFTTPSVLSYVNTAVANQPFGLTGFLTAPSSANHALLNGTLNTASPVNAYSYATNAGTVSPTDDCRNPMVYDVSSNNQKITLN